MSGLAAGDLDRRIVVQRAALVDDGMARRPGGFVAFLTVWASALPVSDGERLRASQHEAVITMRFRVRWSPGAATIDARDRVVFDGRTYAVAGVKEIGRREGLEISATALAVKP